jgi:hypothetical protein
LFEPVDAATIGLFRLTFGLLMVWNLSHYTLFGRLERLYFAPMFLFKYPHFEWLSLLPHSAMVALVWALEGAALLIALGWYSRVASGCFALGYGYLLMVSRSVYNNHDYLIVLLAGVLAAMPIERAFAIGASRRPSAVPRWALWLLRFQLGLPYLMGAIAKLNSDWLLRAQPMTLWLRGQEGAALSWAWLHQSWAGFFFSWGGFLFDLLIVPALLWRRTRWLACAAVMFFHLTNASLFVIGVFPWLMIAATGTFFAPDWPRRLFRGKLLGDSDAEAEPNSVVARRIVASALAVWVLLQLLVPMRHLIYPGWVDWNEDGFNFAWRMKLRDKRGSVGLVVHDRARGRDIEITDLRAGLTGDQYAEMIHDPKLLQQYAVVIARRLREGGLADIQVRAHTSISLNGRPRQALVDPDVDLLSVDPRRAGSWVVPLRKLQP